jgi:hypothetical protein
LMQFGYGQISFSGDTSGIGNLGIVINTYAIVPYGSTTNNGMYTVLSQTQLIGVNFIPFLENNGIFAGVYYPGQNGPYQAANNNPQTGVPTNPCASAGGAPGPSVYAARGNMAASVTNSWDPYGMSSAAGGFLGISDLAQFGRGFPLDAQALGGSRSYGNYAFGVYMAAGGWTLPQALSGANDYAHYSGASYTPADGPMDATHPYILAANVANITNGYNAQLSGTVCHK